MKIKIRQIGRLQKVKMNRLKETYLNYYSGKAYLREFKSTEGMEEFKEFDLYMRELKDCGLLINFYIKDDGERHKYARLYQYEITGLELNP